MPPPVPHHHGPVALALVGLLLADGPAGEVEEDVLEAGLAQVDAVDRDAVLLGHHDELGDAPLPSLHGQGQDVLVELGPLDPIEPAEGVQEGRRVPLELERDDVAAEDVLEPGRRVEGHELAVVHDGDAVAEEVGLLHVVGRQDDRHAGLFVELADVLPDVAARLGVEAQGRLVEEEDLGPVDQAAGDLEAALHAARVLLDERPRPCR